MKVAVLCGGKGSRLGEPIKCLTEVAGRPFMDWKLEQLERCGATDITLIVGPFLHEFYSRYADTVRYIADQQTGIRDALRIADIDGWWTWGDVLLEQRITHWPGGVCFVTPGEHIAGLWLDAGLYHGPGPWRMAVSDSVPHHINTPEDLAECEAYLRGAHETVHRLG